MEALIFSRINKSMAASKPNNFVRERAPLTAFVHPVEERRLSNQEGSQQDRPEGEILSLTLPPSLNYGLGLHDK